MSRKWVAIYSVYGAVLLLYAVLIAATGEDSARARMLELAVFVVLPGLVFVGAAIPLQRRWPHRILLFAVGVLAGLLAAALVIFSWGLALPIGGGLLAIAVADFERVMILAGWRRHRALFAVAALIIIAGATMGFSLTVAVAVIAIVIGVVAWRLRRAGASTPRESDG